MIQFFNICNELHVDVLKAVALGLGMGEDYFYPFVDQAWHTLRLLNYPSVKKALLDGVGQSRASAHSGDLILFIFSIHAREDSHWPRL